MGNQSKREVLIEPLNTAECTKTVFIICYKDPAVLVSVFDTQLEAINGAET
jgi:hypothetical protein